MNIRPNISICQKELCTGCAACQNICNHNAIIMEIGSDGFLYPKVLSNKCVECRLCNSICPINKPVEKKEPLAACMAWTNDKSIRERSSSGGVFSSIAITILQENGVVYGAGYDRDMNVCHQYIEKIEQLDILRGSKYVQSATDNVFRAVKQHLITGRKVYFVGTPCQVAGLKAFLHKDYDNLLTSDFVCHGCPSNDAFQKQLALLATKLGEPICDFRFRSKKRFGQGYDCEILTQSGERKFLNIDLLPFFYGFWKNIILRDSCYQCNYAVLQRVSDITLGDYWTIKRNQYANGGGKSKGVSLCLLNTIRGEKAMNKAYALTRYRVAIDEAVKAQGHLRHSVKMPAKHKPFMESYAVMPYSELYRKFLTPNTKYYLKMRFRNFIKIISFYKLWK